MFTATIEDLNLHLKEMGFKKEFKKRIWNNKNFEVKESMKNVFSLYINGRKYNGLEFNFVMADWNDFIDFKNGIKDLIS